MQKLINSVQNYARGSKTVTELYIANPRQQPMAELWIRRASQSSSRITTANGETVSCVTPSKNKTAMLGEAVANRFGELPFCLKYCAPHSALYSGAQTNATRNRFRERKCGGYPRKDAARRNYKDPNHKPELVLPGTFHGDERVPQIF